MFNKNKHKGGVKICEYFSIKRKSLWPALAAGQGRALAAEKLGGAAGSS